ncbi:MAG: hypothetical protein V1859_02330 [archaeon]
MEKIKFYIESKNGHDEIDVPKSELKAEVEKQLNDNKLVTLENKDGSTEILTKKDIPENCSSDWKNTFQKSASKQEAAAAIQDKAPVKPTPVTSQVKEYAKKFEHVVSATVTNKAKGG